MIRMIIRLTVWGAIVYGLIWVGWRLRNPPAGPTPTRQTQPGLPTFRELQQRLNDEGYDAGLVDGKVGKRTLAAWDRYICDRHAAKYDHYYREQ